MNDGDFGMSIAVEVECEDYDTHYEKERLVI